MEAQSRSEEATWRLLTSTRRPYMNRLRAVRESELSAAWRHGLTMKGLAARKGVSASIWPNSPWSKATRRKSAKVVGAIVGEGAVY